MVAVRVRFAERRSNFVAAVSHELKTPLTAIRMYGEMLRDGMVGDDGKRQEYYGTITAESERLTRLINNVLEFSRLEQGTREMSLVAGPIGPVVREAAGILQPHAREVGFHIEVEVEDGLPPVRFDRDAVQQVVFNLVDNALKYARDAGDRVIAVRCFREGDGVAVAVRDRGPGVPARHLAKIFEPFYRGENELTRTAKGTGIGLALVRGLADTMGAAVTGRNLADGGFEVALSFRTAPLG
jgi:signal transduction histidine kinase